MEKTNTCSGGMTTNVFNIPKPLPVAYNWGLPKLLQINEVGETLEIIYSQTGICTPVSFLSQSNVQKRVFKIVYSFVDGKLNKSEPIYGKIIPAMDEYYTFED